MLFHTHPRAHARTCSAHSTLAILATAVQGLAMRDIFSCNSPVSETFHHSDIFWLSESKKHTVLIIILYTTELGV